MIKLNLLPPQDKKKLELIAVKELTTSLITWVLILLVIFSLILAAIFLYLSLLLRSQRQLIKEKEEGLAEQQLLEMEGKIKEANNDIAQVSVKQKELISWALIMEELSKLMPRSFYLRSLHYQKENNQIKIDGWASTRNELLLFQESLEESSFFDELDAPLSNLLKQSDINFEFTFKPNTVSLDGTNKE